MGVHKCTSILATSACVPLDTSQEKGHQTQSLSFCFWLDGPCGDAKDLPLWPQPRHPFATRPYTVPRLLRLDEGDSTETRATSALMQSNVAWSCSVPIIRLIASQAKLFSHGELSRACLELRVCHGHGKICHGHGKICHGHGKIPETADIHVASRRLVAPHHVKIGCPAMTQRQTCAR